MDLWAPRSSHWIRKRLSLTLRSVFMQGVFSLSEGTVHKGSFPSTEGTLNMESFPSLLGQGNSES